MKSKLTRITVLVLTLMLAFSLASCGSEVNEKNVAVYIQGNLDMYYVGTCSEDYLKLMDYTAEEITDTYNEGLDIEFNYMAQWFMIEPDYLSEDMYSEGLALLAAVYSHSKYTVKEPVKNDEGTYMVEVSVDPVDVFAQVYDGDAVQTFADEFSTKYADVVDPDSLTIEERTAYEDEWARGIFDLCWAAEKNAGYTETESIVLQVKPDDNDEYTLVDSDFESLDYMVLTYSVDE